MIPKDSEPHKEMTWWKKNLSHFVELIRILWVAVETQSWKLSKKLQRHQNLFSRENFKSFRLKKFEASISISWSDEVRKDSAQSIFVTNWELLAATFSSDSIRTETFNWNSCANPSNPFFLFRSLDEMFALLNLVKHQCAWETMIYNFASFIALHPRTTM